VILADMSEWKTAPGRILRWRPTASAKAAADAAPVDPGPPSILQNDHLLSYQRLAREGGTHRAWTGVATHIDGPLVPAAMTRALERLIRTHGGFRTWFDLSGATPVRHLVSEEAVAMEIVEDDAGEWGDGEGGWDTALQTYLTNRFDTECTPGSWPGFCFGVVEHSDGFGVFWGCDHAFTDGASQIMLASEIADLYAAELAAPGGPEVVPGALPRPEECGDFRSYVRQERQEAAQYGPDSPDVAEWVRGIADNGRRLPRFPLPLGLAEGEKAPVVIRCMTLLEEAEVAAFERLCKEADARFSGGVFAAVAATDQALAGWDRYFGVTVLSTRNRGPYARSQGWFCAFAPVEFDVAGAEDFGALAARAQEALTRAKRLSRTPVNLVLETLVRTQVCPPEALGSPQLLSYLDLRWFPGAGRPADARGVHFTGCGRTSNASLWINREDDRLALLAQVPDTAQAAESVGRYHEHLRDVFRKAAAAG
jgi:hypothetical protein